MLNIDDIIELKSSFKTKDKLSFATRYLVQINFTFDLTVKSGDFAGTAHFCILKKQVEDFCNEIFKICSNSSGEATLSDYDSDGYIKLTFIKNQKIKVKGQVGGSHESNFLNYEFTVDQFALLEFAQNFQKLLVYKDDF